MIQNARVRTEVRRLGRQFLHAEKLAITHPETLERVEFQAPLPLELAELLEGLEIESK